MAAKKVTKATDAQEVSNTLSISELDSITARLSKIEDKQALLIKGFEFAAKTIKPIFGHNIIGLVFEELAKKLKQ